MELKNLKSLSWAFLLWGVLSIIMGILVMAWPDITLKVLLIILGVYLFAAGAVMVIGSIADREENWVGGLIIGVLSVLAGIYMFGNPQISGLVVLYVIAGWALVTGVLQMAAGFEVEEGKGWLIFGGIVSILFGLLMFGRPLSGALALIWVIGLYSIINGLFMMVTGFKVRGFRNDLRETIGS
jgi:uncharacterized membrane protein HdeD (DUF308 family)